MTTDPTMPETAAWIGTGHLREVCAGNDMNVYLSSERDRFTDIALVVREEALAYAESLAEARVAQERERCAGAEAAREQRWIDWLVEHGLLHYYQSCQRPDRSHGPAWVLRTPYMTNGDSCEAWHADSAAGALRSFLRAQDTQPPETGKEKK